MIKPRCFPSILLPGRAAFRVLMCASSAWVATKTSSFAQPAPGGAAEPAVELPTFTVTDSRVLPKPEAWRYAQIQGFEILSNASDRSTSQIIRDFEIFHQALANFWPGMSPRSSGSISIILCARKSRFDAFVPTVAAATALPTREITGKETVAVVLDGNTPVNETRADIGLASLFLKDEERAAIVLDLQAVTLNLATPEAAEAAAQVPTDDSALPGNNDFRIDHTKQLFREFVYYQLSRIQPRAPAWFEEGMAQLLMGVEITSTSITFGKIEDPNEQSIGGVQEDRDFNRALQRRALLSFSDFFEVEHGSVTARNNLGNTWAKQAQAFVHMCFYGRGQRYQKGLFTFIDHLQKGEKPSESLFKESFGVSYRSMMTELRGYIDMTDYKAFGVKTKKGEKLPIPEKLVLRDATPAEVGRIKGDALRLGGHAEAAHLELIAPFLRGERDPRLLAALGLAERAAGQDERARKFLDAAAKEKVVRPRVYLELARLRYADAQAAPGEAGGKLSGVQVHGVLEPLFVARGQPPSLAEVYLLIADVWLHSGVAPTPENLAVVYEGVRRFPAESELIYRAAVLGSRHGLPSDAAVLAAYGFKSARDDETKARFLKLQETLPPVPAPTPALAAPANGTSKSPAAAPRK